MKDKLYIKILKKFILLVFATTIILPIIIIVFFSLIDKWVWPYVFPNEISVRAINEIISRDIEIIRAIITSTFVALIVSILAVVVGILTSRALVLYDFFGKRIVYFISFFPFMIPIIAFTLGIQGMFIKIGISSTFIGVIVSHLVYSLPYAVHILLSGTLAIGKSFEEQGLVLGANKWAVFRKITLPLLAPSIVTALSMAYIVSFGQYFITLIIGGGKIKTFSIFLFPYLQSGDRIIASAYSLIFIVSALIMLLIFEIIGCKAIKKAKGGYYET